MSIYRDLSKRIMETNYLSLDDLEDIIKLYFEMWQQNAINQGLTTTPIVKRRNAILAKQKELEVQKCLIEKDLLIAKSKIKNKQKVDMEWMARANFAFRMKKMQLKHSANELTNLKTYEKQRNIERMENEDRQVRAAFYQIVKDKVGKNLAKKMFDEALAKVNQNNE